MNGTCRASASTTAKDSPALSPGRSSPAGRRPCEGEACRVSGEGYGDEVGGIRKELQSKVTENNPPRLTLLKAGFSMGFIWTGLERK